MFSMYSNKYYYKKRKSNKFRNYSRLNVLGLCDNSSCSCCIIKFITLLYIMIINYSVAVHGTREIMLPSSYHITGRGYHGGGGSFRSGAINGNGNGQSVSSSSGSSNNNNLERSTVIMENNVVNDPYIGLSEIDNINNNIFIGNSNSNNNNNNNNNIRRNNHSNHNHNLNNNNSNHNNNNINNNNNNSNVNMNSNNVNNLHIGLSSCQTVCACKWKGGKQTVECIDRALITIPENIDPTTQVLDMSGNNLQIIPTKQFLRSNLLNLQKLYLRNCRIGQIDNDAFEGLTNLVELDLSHNLLTSVPSITFIYIQSLRDLILSSNPIQKIESYSFRNIPTLQKLDLSHCDIQNISPQAFENLELLQTLKLNGNKLYELRPRTVETLSKLHNIELHDNPWMCDCRLRVAKIWLTEKNIPYPVAPICSGGPERVIDRTFNDLHIDDFACKPEMLPVNTYVESVSGENSTITCRSAAVPTPKLNWYWNGRLLGNGTAFSSYQRVYIFEDGDREKRSRLVLTNSQETDSSEFYCVAENRAGTAERNFTLHVVMRTAGMASLGSGQIVGLSAALVILILFILLIILFLLVRMRRQPFIDSKTPNHLEIITTVNQSNTIQCKQQQINHSNSNSQSNAIVNGIIPNSNENGGGNFNTKNTLSAGNNFDDAKLTNPVQKPPRLTDVSYSINTYDNNANNSNVLSAAATSCFISPTASAGNNPDLINDTKKFGSDEFTDLKIPAILTAKTTFIDPLAMPTTSSATGSDILNKPPSTSSASVGSVMIDRPGSGEYSRAGGCDSLYPSGLWETVGNESLSGSGTLLHPQMQQQTHHHQLHLNPAFSSSTDELFLKRATSATLSGYPNYNDRAPILDNTQLYDLNINNGSKKHGTVDSFIATTSSSNFTSTNSYFSKTFPRTNVGSLSTASGHINNGINSGNSTTSTATTVLSSSIGGGGASSSSNNSVTNATAMNGSNGEVGGGYPSDYGLPLVPGAEQQLQPHHYAHQQQQYNNNVNSFSSNSNNNNNSNTNSKYNGNHNISTASLLPNGMPMNAKTIRVWQKGGVPVLPPVTALKRALTSSSRNSPDEGYQEGCGTDV